MAEIGKIDVYQAELGVYVEWRIRTFCYSLKRDHVFYWSPPFSFGGHTWELWICQYGYKLCGSFIDLCLKRRSTGPPIKQEFSLALKTRDGKKEFEGCLSDMFKDGNDFLSPHSIFRSEFLRRKYEFLPSGILTVVCTMKSPTTAGSANMLTLGGKTITEIPYVEAAFKGEQFSYDKGILAADSLILSPQKKCMDSHMTLAEFLEITVIHKWIKDHQPQQENKEGTSSAPGSFDISHLSDDSLEEFMELMRIVTEQLDEKDKNSPPTATSWQLAPIFSHSPSKMACQ